MGIAAYSANLEAKYEGDYAKIMQPARWQEKLSAGCGAPP